MWAYETSFYQIYPLGFCGAPFENDGKLEHRILKVIVETCLLTEEAFGAGSDQERHSGCFLSRKARMDDPG